MSWKTRCSTPNEPKNTIFDSEWAEKRDVRRRMSWKTMFDAEWSDYFRPIGISTLRSKLRRKIPWRGKSVETLTFSRIYPDQGKLKVELSDKRLYTDLSIYTWILYAYKTPHKNWDSLILSICISVTQHIIPAKSTRAGITKLRNISNKCELFRTFRKLFVFVRNVRNCSIRSIRIFS